ncbi:MAG: hypothetical protein HN416_17980, partial [Nitrospina sp.]|nr:hypothetical protein [Nitrospina sp.]
GVYGADNDLKALNKGPTYTKKRFQQCQEVEVEGAKVNQPVPNINAVGQFFGEEGVFDKKNRFVNPNKEKCTGANGD